jgi:hypothetical protein
MSAFTFTAPVISEQDEAAEWEAMSESERARILAEKYGQHRATTDSVGDGANARCGNKSHQDGLNHQDGLKIMMDAIQTSSDSDKEAYLQAVQQCSPELLHRESNFEHFLACEKHDPWAAARRVLLYWTVRRELFGKVCYQPLTLEGAMKHDVEHLKKGFMYLLLPDAHGRPVLFVDRIRMTKRIVPRPVVARCLFYSLCVAASQLYQDPRHSVVHMQDNSGFVALFNCRVCSTRVWATIVAACSSHLSLLLLFVLLHSQGFDVYQHFDRVSAKLAARTLRAVPTRIMCAHTFKGPGVTM